MFERDMELGRYDEFGGPLTRLKALLDVKRAEKNGVSDNALTDVSDPSYGRPQARLKAMDESAKNRRIAHLAAIRATKVVETEEDELYWAREEQRKTVGVSINALMAIAVAASLVGLGKSFTVIQVAAVMAGFAASFVYFDIFNLLSQVMAQQTKAFVSVGLVSLIWPLCYPSWYSALAVAFAGACWLIGYAMNETWLSSQNFLMTAATTKALHGRSDNDAENYWQANGCRALRTMYWELGQHPTDTELERQLKPAFCLGYWSGQDKILKESNRNANGYRAQIESLSEELSEWRSESVLRSEYDSVVAQLDEYLKADAKENKMISTLKKSVAEANAKIAELEEAFGDMAESNEKLESELAEANERNTALLSQIDDLEAEKKALLLSSETEEEKVERLFLQGMAVRAVEAQTTLSNRTVENIRKKLVAEGRVKGGSPIGKTKQELQMSDEEYRTLRSTLKVM